MSHYVLSGYIEVPPKGLKETLKRQPNGAFLVQGMGPLTVHGHAKLGRLLFAHGAGAGQQSPFMRQFVTSLAAQGVQVLCIDFPYMQQMQETGKRRPPPPIAQTLDQFAQWYALLADLFDEPLWIGGKSMGGRVATLFASEQPCKGTAPGVVIAGYPFHPTKAPDKLRLDHWPKIACPMLILQGERDPFGTRDEVAGYILPPNAQLAWLTDGDHDFKPRRFSGLTQTVLIDEATQVAASFVRAHGTGLTQESNALV
ncbi:alpha/beta fold hydrolase [Halomonas sp. ATBC28]|uniref:alpha/beta fold hydrolase n=1 Tax=unclassified Halomonas TaxID=2609666 RepID=UPI0004807C1B|nr:MULTISPECIES: alpha/beta fold hydrolase [unclassified Halomonas]NAO95752.1 alpha/beta fold hydrolase [Halomonas sp. MG34]PKH61647.1 dienelactone hydrolase [Halomonas sp. Choline-3u-9]QGQ71347.1 alpha/beta fold hydrolase [Halomonas sp. PA16-9]TMU26364.1 alpha/beta fold hydrolase [Halomonas sp. ATBC28]